MADLSITTTEVKAGPGAVVESGVAGEAITRGEALYRDSVTKKVYAAQRDAGIDSAHVVGLALQDATDGQRVEYQSAGIITIGNSASVTEGVIYLLSATAGGLTPHTDHDTGVSAVPASGEFATVIGVGNNDDQIILGILNSGQQIA